MEEIIYKNTIIGIKISHIPQGSIPQTKDNQPLQLVTLKHPKGTHLKAHMHTPKKRTTESLQECLIVKSGKISLDLYTRTGEKIKTLQLDTNEIFILMDGGIGINILEDSELIEVKNGPFVEDKVLLE